MGDKGCAKSSGQGAGGLGWDGFVEVARSRCFRNVFVGSVWPHGDLLAGPGS